MLPVVTFQGTLTADPELHFTPAGHAVANCTIACNDRRNENGQWVDGDATFLRLTVWRKTAENLAESARKGDLLTGWGRLQQTEWEKDGQKRYGFEVIVDSIGPALLFGEARTERARGESPGSTGSNIGPEPTQPDSRIPF